MDSCGGGGAGGTLALARIVGEHLPETVEDFRHLYGVSLWEVSTPEVWYLIKRLLGNAESQLHAAFAGWSGIVKAEQAVLMDVYDLYVRANFKAPHIPYPRPWDVKRVRTVKKRTAREAMAILRPHRETDG